MHNGTVRANHSWYWWGARDSRWGSEIDLDKSRYETLYNDTPYWGGDIPVADWVCVSDCGDGTFGFHLKHGSPTFDVHINRSLDTRADYWVSEHNVVLLHDRWLSQVRALAPEAEFKIGSVFHDGVAQKGWRNVRAGREPLMLSTNGHKLRYCPGCGQPQAKRAARGKVYFFADQPFGDPVMIADGQIYVRADLAEQAELPDPKNSFSRELVPLYVTA